MKTPVSKPVNIDNIYRAQNAVYAIENAIASAINEFSANLIWLDCERLVIEHTMAKHDRNQTKAAKDLGMNRGTLRAKLKKYGMI